jgi:hypothetical protein
LKNFGVIGLKGIFGPMQPRASVALVRGVNALNRSHASSALDSLLRVSQRPRFVSALSAALIYGAAVTPMHAWLGKDDVTIGVLQVALCVGFALSWVYAFHRSLEKSLGVLFCLACATPLLMLAAHSIASSVQWGVWGIFGLFGVLMTSPLWLPLAVLPVAPLYIAERWLVGKRAQRVRAIGASAVPVASTQSELIVNGAVHSACGMLAIAVLSATYPSSQCQCALGMAHAPHPILVMYILAMGLAALGTVLALSLLLVPVYCRFRAAEAFKALRDGRVAGWRLRQHALGYEVCASLADAQLPYRRADDLEPSRAILDAKGALIALAP